MGVGDWWAVYLILTAYRESGICEGNDEAIRSQSFKYVWSEIHWCELTKDVDTVYIHGRKIAIPRINWMWTLHTLDDYFAVTGNGGRNSLLEDTPRAFLTLKTWSQFWPWMLREWGGKVPWVWPSCYSIWFPPPAKQDFVERIRSGIFLNIKTQK
jgi:hypothetical protein